MKRDAQSHPGLRSHDTVGFQAPLPLEAQHRGLGQWSKYTVTRQSRPRVLRLADQLLEHAYIAVTRAGAKFGATHQTSYPLRRTRWSG